LNNVNQWRAEVWGIPRDCLIVRHLPNYSVEQWRVMIIVSGMT